MGRSQTTTWQVGGKVLRARLPAGGRGGALHCLPAFLPSGASRGLRALWALTARPMAPLTAVTARQWAPTDAQQCLVGTAAHS